jgi:transposase
MPRKERQIITEEIKRVVLALSSDEGKTIKTIASIVGINRNAVSKIITIIPTSSSGNSTTEETNRQNERTSLENQVIRNIITLKNDLTLKEIADELFEKTGIRKSESAICRNLKKQNITRKRLSLIPEERNTEDKKNQRVIYASNISRYLKENLVFLDETGFNNHLSRTYGYSEADTKAYRYVPANKGTNLSCMCVISYTGLVAYEMRRGAYNSSLFNVFIEQKLAPIFRDHPEKILIMDNARFHHARDTLRTFEELGISYMFLPPYSPQLNPIEEFFSLIKSNFKTIRNLNNSIEIDLRTVLSENFSTVCPSYYSHMMDWLIKARQRLDFI